MTAPKNRPRLSRDEIMQGLERFPVVMRLDQLAEMIGLSVKTIYAWLAQGRLNPAARKRGKHWLISRNKAVDVLFNGAEWQ